MTPALKTDDIFWRRRWDDPPAATTAAACRDLVLLHADPVAVARVPLAGVQFLLAGWTPEVVRAEASEGRVGQLADAPVLAGRDVTSRLEAVATWKENVGGGA